MDEEENWFFSAYHNNNRQKRTSKLSIECWSNKVNLYEKFNNLTVDKFVERCEFEYFSLAHSEVFVNPMNLWVVSFFKFNEFSFVSRILSLACTKKKPEKLSFLLPRVSIFIMLPFVDILDSIIQRLTSLSCALNSCAVLNGGQSKCKYSRTCWGECEHDRKLNNKESGVDNLNKTFLLLVKSIDWKHVIV